MARRYSRRMNGDRNLANTSVSKLEVHDLDNENNNCQTDEITAAGNEWPYDSLDAVPAEHDRCHWCIGGSNR
jgi:hypothetical protein